MRLETTYYKVVLVSESLDEDGELHIRIEHADGVSTHAFLTPKEAVAIGQQLIATAANALKR